MILRRRLSDNLGLMIVPTICCALTLYFGYSVVAGPRGLFALRNTQGELAMAQHELADVSAQRKALQHRIDLLDDKALDPDLLEELARSVLAQGPPGEVAVPREKH
jgi:cell division protein FtsB